MHFTCFYEYVKVVLTNHELQRELSVLTEKAKNKQRYENLLLRDKAFFYSVYSEERVEEQVMLVLGKFY